jgi:hypothetical protein
MMALPFMVHVGEADEIRTHSAVCKPFTVPTEILTANFVEGVYL